MQKRSTQERDDKIFLCLPNIFFQQEAHTSLKDPRDGFNRMPERPAGKRAKETEAEMIGGYIATDM